MKVFPVILCGALALLAVQSVRAADQGSGGAQVSPPAEVAAPAATQPASSATPAPESQAYDKNGKPMTPEEFDKAAKARMKERAVGSTNRMETRQAKWKKGSKKAATDKAGEKSVIDPAKAPTADVPK